MGGDSWGLVFCVANIKGGVGKTTLSVMLSRYLSLRGFRVLLLDADPQGTASIHAGDEIFDDRGRLLKGMPYILECFVHDVDVDSETMLRNIHSVSDVVDEAFYLLPNSIESSDYDFTIRSRGLQHMLFKRIFSALPLDFDVVIVDCPPYVNTFLLAALSVADIVLIPAETTPQALPGVDKMVDLLVQYRKWQLCNPKGVFIVPTKVKRTRDSRAALSLLRAEYGGYTTEASMPNTVLVNKLFAGKLTVGELVKSGARGGIEGRIVKLLREIEQKALLGGRDDKEADSEHRL